MKLGTETGSLVNSIMSTMNQPEAILNGPATILFWSDRKAGTIIEIEKNMLVVQLDTVTRIDTNGMSESQEYTYERNPNGSKYHFKWNKKHGKYMYVVKSEKNRWGLGCGCSLLLGKREEYYDFTI